MHGRIAKVVIAPHISRGKICIIASVSFKNELRRAKNAFSSLIRVRSLHEIKNHNWHPRFDAAEELDFVGLLEAFGMAAEFGQPCRTVVISENAEAVRCAHGLRILPDDTIDNAPELDLLIVPGGRGARGFMHEIIRRFWNS
jgi:hypothetical protein